MMFSIFLSIIEGYKEYSRENVLYELNFNSDTSLLDTTAFLGMSDPLFPIILDRNLVDSVG
jgi:hypothetical protein